MTPPDAATHKIPCRLCGEPAELRFSATLLRRHPSGFYACTGCGSLETDPPHWLDEAYADARPVRDVWMVGRTESMRTLVSWTLRILGRTDARLFDWGGGNGLLVRMLRDVGIDAYLSDKYASNFYAVGFEVQRGQKADVMTAFEVFEHADDPRRLMVEMTEHAPDVILLSTERYTGQGEDWHYLHQDSGKHVFFYTAEGLRLLAKQFGYDCLPGQSFTIMYRCPLAAWQRAALWSLLASYRRTERVLIALDARKPRHLGATRDVAQLRERGVL